MWAALLLVYIANVQCSSLYGLWHGADDELQLYKVLSNYSLSGMLGPPQNYGSSSNCLSFKNKLVCTKYYGDTGLQFYNFQGDQTSSYTWSDEVRKELLVFQRVIEGPNNTVFVVGAQSQGAELVFYRLSVAQVDLGANTTQLMGSNYDVKAYFTLDGTISGPFAYMRSRNALLVNVYIHHHPTPHLFVVSPNDASTFAQLELPFEIPPYGVWDEDLQRLFLFAPDNIYTVSLDSNWNPNVTNTIRAPYSGELTSIATDYATKTVYVVAGTDYATLIQFSYVSGKVLQSKDRWCYGGTNYTTDLQCPFSLFWN
jgi:hypothetical protein